MPLRIASWQPRRSLTLSLRLSTTIKPSHVAFTFNFLRTGVRYARTDSKGQGFQDRRIRRYEDVYRGRRKWPSEPVTHQPGKVFHNNVIESARYHIHGIFGHLKADLNANISFESMPLDKSRYWFCFTSFRQDIEDGIITRLRGQEMKDELVSKIIQHMEKHEEEDLYALLKREFYSRVMDVLFSGELVESHRALANCRYPAEWYSKARRLKRTIHLHVGPTNSGKTYHALKRLQEAQGETIYAGPLRMLAQEVYYRLNAIGKPTWLLTGDERQSPPGMSQVELEAVRRNLSCTVEMVPMNIIYDVAVIDEIQMLADPFRGGAWTTALLGIPAKEVHLCGEERAVDLVRRIVASAGEELVIHRYQRLTPLKVEDKPVAIHQLQKGDCVVSFSINRIHRLRNRIQNATGKRAAVVYGGLPSEVRVQQAMLFNDPNNDYDYLVASDAIGMGLNLAIKRVVFSSTSKMRRDQGVLPLSIPEMKQIGGRAGRYRTSYQDTNTQSVEKQDSDQTKEESIISESSSLPVADIDDGLSPGQSVVLPLSQSDDQSTPENNAGNALVFENASRSSDSACGFISALQSTDLTVLQDAFRQEPEPLTQAAIQPSQPLIARFYSYFPPGIPYSYIFVRLLDLIEVGRDYFIQSHADTIDIADAIESVKDLRIEDRITICNAPVRTRNGGEVHLIQEMANCVANNAGGGLLQLRSLDLEVLDRNPAFEDLDRLELLHKGLVLYSWLSFRFPGVFMDRTMAFEVRNMTQVAINEVLESRMQDRGPSGFSLKKSYIGAKEDYSKDQNTGNVDDILTFSSNEPYQQVYHTV